MSKSGTEHQELAKRWLLSGQAAVDRFSSGSSVRDAACLVGVRERTVGVWLRWYRAEGLAGVRGHRQAGKGRSAGLTAAQQAALTTKLRSGAAYTAQDAVSWVAQQWGVRYQAKGMYSLLHRLRARPKVPRPHNPKSAPEQQEAWKKGGSPTPCAQPASASPPA